MTSTGRPWAKLILALFSVAFALLLGEILTRVFCPAPFKSEKVWPGFNGQLRDGLFVPDPVAGYRPGPVWASSSGRFGFRNGAEYDAVPGPATDIVLLGDSIIQDGNLGDALKEQLAGRAVKVWVAGIGGYNTLQEAYYLENWIKLEPDVLALGFCLNDFKRSMIVVPAGRKEIGKFVAPDFEPLADVNPYLFQHSAFYRLFQSARFSRRASEQFNPEVMRQNREHVRRGLVQMKQYAARRNIPFLVMLYPMLDRPEQSWQLEAREEARSLFDELGLRWVDVTDDFAMHSSLALRKEIDDTIHPNRKGHDIAARRLLAAFPDVFPP